MLEILVRKHQANQIYINRLLGCKQKTKIEKQLEALVKDIDELEKVVGYNRRLADEIVSKLIHSSRWIVIVENDMFSTFPMPWIMSGLKSMKQKWQIHEQQVHSAFERSEVYKFVDGLLPYVACLFALQQKHMGNKYQNVLIQIRRDVESCIDEYAKRDYTFKQHGWILYFDVCKKFEEYDKLVASVWNGYAEEKLDDESQLRIHRHYLTQI